MKYAPLLTVLALVSSYAFAQQIIITDSTTKHEYGPYKLYDGVLVNISGHSYTIAVLDSVETTNDLLDRRFIPTAEFRDASLSAVVDFLRETTHSGASIPRVDFVLDRNIDNTQSVTLSLSNPTLRALLDAVCRLTVCTYSIDEHGIVWIQPIKESGQHAPPEGRGEAPRP